MWIFIYSFFLGDVQINKERIVLCEATARVMKCGFDILGIETVEKM